MSPSSLITMSLGSACSAGVHHQNVIRIDARCGHAFDCDDWKKKFFVGMRLVWALNSGHSHEFDTILSLW